MAFNYGGITQGVGTPPGGSGVLDRVLELLGSKGGQTAVNAVGAGLSAYGQGKQADADRAATAQQFAANMAQRQAEGDQGHQLNQATAAEAANPLGANQDFATRNALTQALLGGARNFSVTPGDPRVASAMGASTGGMRLPEGGLDPAMLERLFGGEATQASIAQHEKAVGQINPRAPQYDFGPTFGKSADGSENAFATDVRTSNAAELARQDQERARQRAIIQRAIDEDIQGQKQQNSGGGVKGFLGGLLKTASPFLGMIPGAGIPLAMGAAGLGSALQGNGVGSSLLNAGVAGAGAKFKK